MQIVSGDNLHEMSNFIFLEKLRIIIKLAFLKFLPTMLSVDGHLT